MACEFKNVGASLDDDEIVVRSANTAEVFNALKKDWL